MAKKMDVPQPQVILEAKIIEINKNALKNLGINWSQSITANFQEIKRPVSFNNVQSYVGSAFKIYSLARNPLQFTTVLEMLENDNLAKTLSNPRIITMNNQQAEIFVGDEIPYTVTTVTNGVAINDVRFVDPGIRLKITPSIIDKDFVVVKIEPEVSYIYSFIGPQNQYPWVKKRNATAYVRIENNHPFILGGLLDKEDQKNLYKVPILGNLPWGLGNLFSYQSHTVTDSELIIVVVPVIVNQ
jgi:type II secretory pathway component GspD/PulD (secretin)